MTIKNTKSTKIVSKGVPGRAILTLAKTTGKIIDANLAAKKLFKKNIKEIKKYNVILSEKRNAASTNKVNEGEDFTELKEMFHTLTQSVKDGIIMADIDDNIFFWNQAAERMFGYKKEEVIGKKLHTIIPAKMDWKKYGEDIEQFSETGKNWVIGGTFELEVKRKDNTIFLIDLSVTSALLKDKRIAIGICRDITDRKKLQESLNQKNAEEESILDSIPAWIFYKDDKNNFIRVNNAFCKVMGKKKEELEGKSCSDFYTKEKSDLYYQSDLEVINSGSPKRDIVESMQSPQGEFWLKTDKIPYRDSQNKIIGVIGFSVDITKQKTAETEFVKYANNLEKINKLMVGRELRMIELKNEIIALKESPGVNINQNTVENMLRDGIALEEGVIGKLGNYYIGKVNDSGLSESMKKKIVGQIKILYEDSKGHKESLEKLIND